MDVETVGRIEAQVPVAVMAVLLDARALGRGAAAVGGRWWLAVVAVALAGTAVQLLLVPIGPIDPNDRGLELWAAVTRRSVADGADPQHGFAHLATWMALQPL